ncbi:hypothetical protein ANCDUO_07204 [Ancylostoma duodenale]|uniref:Uncharacterized protein n=1 Tax=Ancylostoma duodenale TaxID=51022 RepID=A0A0C2DJ44_9BILA|nr:hypothetical protein ANCDUO_07204 [Ancylostoma duodenale]
MMTWGFNATAEQTRRSLRIQDWPWLDKDLRLCGGDAQQFCALSSTARSWYIIGWVGTCLVILGLAFFLAILSANYAHVGNASKYVELRDLALETPTGDYPHLKPENAFDYPRRSSKEQLSAPSNGGYSRYNPVSTG